VIQGYIIIIIRSLEKHKALFRRHMASWQLFVLVGIWWWLWCDNETSDL